MMYVRVPLNSVICRVGTLDGILPTTKLVFIGPSCRFTETPPGPDFLGHHAVETFLHAGQALEALIVIAVCDVMASAYRWATLTVLDTCVGSLGFSRCFYIDVTVV